MSQKRLFGLIIAGSAAGVVNGLFGAGGGMVLLPLLTLLTREKAPFGASVAIIAPICVVTLLTAAPLSQLPWGEAVPYLAGSALGGVGAAIFGKHIPTVWLHRILGVFILWGGVRYLWG